MPPVEWTVVGAGFTGATAARLLAERGFQVRVVEARSHIGGNAFDVASDAGVFRHVYGPHLFHTSSQRVVEFLTPYADWMPYRHRVIGTYGGLRFPLPPNFALLDAVLGPRSDAAKKALSALYAKGSRVPLHELEASDSPEVREAAEVVRGIVFTTYTKKMWGPHAEELMASAQARVPVIVGYGEGYFTDSFQALPREGYTELFRRILEHPRIAVELGVRFEIHDVSRVSSVLFTGPLDALLGYELGVLPYRSIRFAESGGVEPFVDAFTVNYNDDSRPETRATDMALTVGGGVARTIVVSETPEEHRPGENEPLYPVPAQKWRDLHALYLDRARSLFPELVVAGRMGRYQYYDMDQACATAIRLASAA